MKVLLQEQDEAMRAVIRPMLAARGLTTIEATSPWEAAALASRCRPDIVLLSATDVYCSGREVPGLLANRAVRTPTLLLGASQPCSNRADTLPVDGYMPYPFDAQQLCAAIEALVTIDFPAPRQVEV